MINNKEFNELINERKNHFISDEEKEQNVIEWNQFFKNNIDIFTEDFLEIPLFQYQKNMLLEIQESDMVTLVCSRGSSKSFCTAISALYFALLRSNCNVLVVSLTLAQSNLLISSKIDKELSNTKTGISPVLRQLRKDGWMQFKKDSNTGGLIVEFENGSKIFSCALGESLRGNRAQVVILDESAICSKTIYQQVAEPTLTQRQFKGRPADYIETTPQIFLSSPKTKSNWLWRTLVNCVNGFYKRKSKIKYGFMCVDVLSATASGIQSPKQYYQRKKNTDDLTFQQEYMNIFLGSSENSIFKMEDFEQNQILEKPFYPTTLDDILDKKHNNYNYSDDWVRIIVCDIALATGEDNDNSIYIFMAINKKTGERRVENIDMKNGLNTVLQVMMIKRYFYDYKADYIMLDVKGNGAGIFDLLTTETYDAEFNKVYPAWTVCLDKKLQISSDVVMNDKIQRTISNNAEEVIIPYAGTSDLNSQMHLLLRKALKDKIISFLKDDSEMQYKIEDKDPTFATKSSEEKAFIMNPYLQTRLMINESVSLEVKFMDNGNIKLSEAKRTNTKDRYMTLAMANFLADRIHNKYLSGNEDSDLDEADFYEIYNY